MREPLAGPHKSVAVGCLFRFDTSPPYCQYVDRNMSSCIVFEMKISPFEAISDLKNMPCRKPASFKARPLADAISEAKLWQTLPAACAPCAALRSLAHSPGPRPPHAAPQPPPLPSTLAAACAQCRSCVQGKAWASDASSSRTARRAVGFLFKCLGCRALEEII